MERAKRTMLWSPLKERGFRQLFLGQVMADFANWLDFIALSALIVYAWGHGSMALAALSVCIGAPYVLLGPLLSVRLRSLPGKQMLVVCSLLHMVVACCLAWAPSLPVLLALVLMKTSITAVFDPVRQGAVKRLVEPANLAQASSLSQMSANLTKIFGPMAGGALMAWLGTKAPFLLSGGLYLLSAAALCFLPAWSGKAEQEEKRAGGLREAWRFLLGRARLKAAVVYVSAVFFLIFLYDGLFVLLAQEAGLNEDGFGLMIGAVGVGSVGGAVAAGQWSGWQRHPIAHMTRWGIVSGLLIVVVGLAAMGVIPPVLLFWLPLCAAIGYCGAQSAVPFGYVLQTETTEETIGPVSALANALQTSSMLIAPVIGASLAAWWGAGSVFAFVGCLTVGIALWTYSRMKQQAGGSAATVTEAVSSGESA
ncbi:putative MFS family arabinose efflux permease [Paenibacillus phyllosphaerae]|uniref:Putative MFS family arabinose efflux permease n=1 Tax=Paenibacillus phyllosphaerae TaxID=274593 RepID=A0A7W5AY05_9BACL|nr:MFS transporter [Paenibacillus phyllosphaerae]MBB3110797.1 putative MFS family arabinose efflux permease [Paenibacillus phyllosphaerae]